MKRPLLVAVLLGLAVVVMSSPAAAQAGSNSLDDQLLQAAGNGDTAAVQQLLDKGANIEAKDKWGNTPLLIAARNSNIEIVKLLLEKGANIEAKTGDGNTALIAAAYWGQTEAVKLLLEKGANIEAKEKYGGTPLMLAVDNHRTEVVKLLLDKGANIEARDIAGRTALIAAARQGNIEVVKLLLEKGANIEAKDDGGSTPLITATSFDHAEVVHLLEQAIAKNPQSALAESASALQRQPYDEALREKVVKLAASLPALPPIPEEARQLFLQASELMKQASKPADFFKPVELLRKALVIAPWWGNAYYNLSRALELSGQYDEAVKQLNYYLELKPSEADATAARAHIAVIQAEKESAAQKKQENEGVLAVKYVSGGATRLRWADAPAYWNDDGGIATLYTYAFPEDPFVVNVFRMPNGHLLAIDLEAQSNNGMYASDKIAVWVLPATKGACVEGRDDFIYGAQSYTEFCGDHYDVSVSNQPNATVTVTYPATGASITLPVALLYRGRYLRGAWSAGKVYQGGSKGVYVLTFDNKAITAAWDNDPNVNAMGLTPTSVTPYQGNKK